MDATAKNVVANTTRVAAIILLEGAAASQKRKLDTEELKLIGRALGWMVYATYGTENDVLKRLDKEIASELPAASKAAPSKTMASVEDVGDPTAIEGRGRRRGKKMRGGAPPIIILILGAIGAIFGINTVGNVYHTAAQRDIVRDEALRQIKAACPAELVLGPPPKPFVDWKGEYSSAKSAYDTTLAQCEAIKAVGKARVDAAEGALKAAWDRIPAQVGTLATGASLVSTGAVTGPAVSAAFMLGKSVHTIATSFVQGTIPVGGSEFSSFINTIADGFPVPTAAPAAAAGEGAPAAAAPAVAAPAVAAPAAPAFAAPARQAAPSAKAAAPALASWPNPQGGRRRKTKKVKKAKRRATRRRVFVPVKFAY